MSALYRVTLDLSHDWTDRARAAGGVEGGAVAAVVPMDRRLVLPVNCAREHQGLTLDWIFTKSLKTVGVSLPSVWVPHPYTG